METNILPEENLLAIDKGDQGVELGTIKNKSGLVGDSVADPDL